MEENETLKAIDTLNCVVNETYSEDNDLTEEEWYKRIGVTEEDLQGKFKGMSEEDINHYLIYSCMRTKYVSMLALKSELKKFSDFLKFLEVIKEEK